MRWFVGLGAVLSMAVIAPLQAQAPSGPLPPEQIIAVRQAVMDLQQGVATAMKAAVDAKADVKPLADGAKGLAASARLIPTLFPVGTERGHDTKAKAEIWSDWSTFTKNAEALASAADKLAMLADADDKAGFAEQFLATGRACGACHRAFKEKS